MTDLPRENVQSYLRPPQLEPVAQRIRVILGGATVAETGRAPRVLETHHAPTCCLLPAAWRRAGHPSPGFGDQLLRMEGRRPLLPHDRRRQDRPACGPDP